MEQQHKRRADPAGFAIAGLLAFFAIVIAWDTSRLTLTATYGMGPKAAAFIVCIGLGILAVGNFIVGLRGEYPPREELNVTAIMRILGGLAALIAIIGFGYGFILGTALLFAMTASAFGRKALLTDLLIGLALGILVYLLFSKLLSLALPAGPVEHFINGLF